MEKMQEKDFDELEPTCQMEQCKHERVIKLYENATHCDYGCLDCHYKSFRKEDFFQSNTNA